jgi:Zn ribbon nucleic-acid-binding protein
MRQKVCECVQCGQPVPTRWGRFCEACRMERLSHGGRPGKARSVAAHPSKTKKKVTVKARCPKCRRAHGVQMRRDPGRTVWEFCKHHKGLRQMDYIPTTEISRDILRIRG